MTNTQFAYVFFGVMSFIGVCAVVIIDFLHVREKERTKRWEMYYHRAGQENPVKNDPPKLFQ